MDIHFSQWENLITIINTNNLIYQMGQSSFTDFLRKRFIRGAGKFFRVACISILGTIAIDYHAEAENAYKFSNEQISLDNGNYYVGEIVNDKMHGKGKIYKNKKIMYVLLQTLTDTLRLISLQTHYS